jgi:predicted secreted protein
MSTDSREFLDTDETRRLQLAMALGLGTGHLLATPGAVLTAQELFAGLPLPAAEWAAIGQAMIGLARTLGQAAASRAVCGGRAFVTSEDIRWAWEQVTSKS